MSESSWSVAVVMRNSSFEVLRFLSWYLEAGAEHIHIVFHDPDDPHIAMLAGHPKIECIPFTGETKLAMGLRPEASGPPQIVAGSYIYPRVGAEWLLRVDCDELVHCDGRRIGALLAEVPAGRQTVVFRPAEAVAHDGGDGELLFRLPMEPETVVGVYGKHAPLMERRQGLVSHAFGKSAHRTGIEGLQVQEHNALLPGAGKRTLNVKRDHRHRAYLLHFNGEDYAEWRRAADRRSQNSSFGPELSGLLGRMARDGAGEAEYRALFAGIGAFDSARAERLVALGAGIRLRLDFAALIRRHFPDAAARIAE